MWMARENWVDEEEWSEESSGRKRRVTYAATKYSVSLRFLPLFAGIPACPIFTVSIHRSSFTATLLDIISRTGDDGMVGFDERASPQRRQILASLVTYLDLILDKQFLNEDLNIRRSQR